MAKDFKLSTEIRKAMKKPEFCKLLAEYVQEISDPENKKRNEEELVALEKQRGVDMKYVHPKPGFVMKSFLLPESTRKIFINVCHNEHIAPASSSPAKGKKGENWSIPYTISPPREDVDKAKNKCTLVDAIFNTKTFQKGQESVPFKRVLVDTVFDGLESQLKLKVDREKVIYLRMPYKGVPDPAVIRTKTEADSKQQEEIPSVGGMKIPFPPMKEEQPHTAQKGTRLPTEPKYTVLHRGEFTMQDFTNDRESTLIKRPKELVVDIELPGVECAGSVELDIFEKRVVLKSEKPKLKLDLALHYPVDEEKGKARFDKTKKVLTITLPVLPPPPAPKAPPQSPLVTPLEADGTDNGCSQAESLSSTATASIATKEAEKTSSILEQDGVEQDKVEDSQTDVDSPCAPLEQDTDSTSAIERVQEKCSAKGKWMCPPFSYRQEDAVVVFCLHTAHVKENSMVQCFDEHYVQLTYTTHNGEKYSFYVSFPGGCDLDVDDCSVDISQDNVVLLLKKDLPESSTDIVLLWEGFAVGLNASQTTEKLFLTSSNVESVMERLGDFPDPWKSPVWSDSATVCATMEAGGDRLDIQIKEAADNPISTDTSITTTSDTAITTDTAVTSDTDTADTGTKLNSRASPTGEKLSVDDAASKSSSDGSSTQAATTEVADGGTKDCSRDAIARSTQEATPIGDDSSLKDGGVEAGGEEDAVLVNGEGTETSTSAVGGEKDAPDVTASNIKLSSKLLYSLD